VSAPAINDPRLPEEIRISADGPVRIVTLDRPGELNAVNEEMHGGLARVWQVLAEDESAAAVVLTGAGTAFCAGGDFHWLIQINEERPRQDAAIADAATMMLGMIKFPLPVIAAVNGPAVGLGCSLTIFADIVLMSRTAHLADPHVPVGLVAGDGGAMWPLLVGMHRAKEFLFTGDRIEAEEALRLGLANRVVEPDDVLPEALRLAHRLAKLPPAALQDTKRALNSHLMAAWPAAEMAMLAERQTMGSSDHGSKLHRLLRRAT
jgi:enoyl-CoA hydratase/carnithine racemase